MNDVLYDFQTVESLARYLFETISRVLELGVDFDGAPSLPPPPLHNLNTTTSRASPMPNGFVTSTTAV